MEQVLAHCQCIDTFGKMFFIFIKILEINSMSLRRSRWPTSQLVINNKLRQQFKTGRNGFIALFG